MDRRPSVTSALSGSLLCADLPLSRLGLSVAADAEQRRVETFFAHYHSIRERLGPASGPRRTFDLVADPLARALGYRIIPLAGGRDTADAIVETGGVARAVVVVSSWGEPPPQVWRHAVRRGLAHGVRWALCVTGDTLCIFDADRAYARRFAAFDLQRIEADEQARRVLWALLAAANAGAAGLLSLELAVVSCERHRKAVGISLRQGVCEALLGLVGAFRAASRRRPESQLLDESLTVVYRLLFLLFAEARSLVPRWHPIYRDSYTLEALTNRLQQGLGVATGIWEAIQAIARLAHRGCRAGSLRVPPFNGRLFSPVAAPLADTVPLDDRTVARALLDLTTRRGAAGLERISYAELGVEQLGAVYEHLLDYDLAPRGAARAVLVPTGRRKATGSFYTPRALTELMVRRTLAPIVQGATAARILDLRILDPAMGSGAFLVAACRYLAAAYEQALVSEGRASASDIDEDERASFRRLIAQRCLYGVDVNPMAVQLGRLSLWLATLATGKPLTFLDHRLQTGNSLVGGSIEDLARRPVPGGGRRASRELPLLAAAGLDVAIESTVAARVSIADTPDDTLEQVRHKERTFAALHRSGPLGRWKGAADLWCAAWFTDRARVPSRPAFRALVDLAVGTHGSLAAHVGAPFLAEAREVAARERFFHWPLEFPEIFYNAHGGRRRDEGFDAVVGNPPWEMLREDGSAGRALGVSAFVRGSGGYRLQGQGHGNLYQLFVERTLGLLKPDGRAGLIVPSGFGSDQACARLRRELFDRTAIDMFASLENRDGIFPIHRGLKFLLITFTRGGTTSALSAEPPLRSPDALERMPDAGTAVPAPIVLTRSLLERISGPSLAVPDIRTAADLEIVSEIAFRVPATADPEGWGIRFGRELNATDDRPHFTDGGRGLAVVEGKHLTPFAVAAGAARFRLPARRAATLLDPALTYRRARLAYRDVASSSNRTTLIAAILPRGVVSTHTVLCLKNLLDDEVQHFLCGVFNSYVANYLVRMRVGTHVSAAIVARLPVPKPERTDPRFRAVVRAARRLAQGRDAGLLAQLNVLVSTLYGLSQGQFARVLETFPLVSPGERAQTLALAVQGV